MKLGAECLTTAYHISKKKQKQKKNKWAKTWTCLICVAHCFQFDY